MSANSDPSKTSTPGGYLDPLWQPIKPPSIPLRQPRQADCQLVKILSAVLSPIGCLVIRIAECDAPFFIRSMVHRFFQRDDVMGGKSIVLQHSPLQTQAAKVQISFVDCNSCPFPCNCVSEPLGSSILSARWWFLRTVETKRMHPAAPLARLHHCSVHLRIF